MIRAAKRLWWGVIIAMSAVAIGAVVALVPMAQTDRGRAPAATTPFSRQALLAEETEPIVAITVSPDSSKVAYVSAKNVSGQPMLANPNATGILRIRETATGQLLTELGDVDYRGLSWAPDGTQIAYFSGDQRRWRIGLLAVDGRPLKELATGGPLANLNQWRFSWSPDSRRLAVGAGDALVPAGQAIASAPGGRLVIIDVQRGSIETVLGDAGADTYVAQVQWFPTGRDLLLTTMDARTLGEGPRQIQTLDLQSRRLTTLVDRTEFAHLAFLSPNGALVAYTTRDGEAISVMSANGANKRRLWSHDEVAIPNKSAALHLLGWRGADEVVFVPTTTVVANQTFRIHVGTTTAQILSQAAEVPGATAASPRAVAKDGSMLVIQTFRMPSQADPIKAVKFALWRID